MSTEAATVPLRIEGELTIYRASGIKEILVAASGSGGCLELDLSAVSEIDTAGIQLLMAAKRRKAQHGGELALTGHSPAVLDAFALYDLAGYFGDPALLQGPGSNGE